ncbi:MAG: biotin--[acetyl-CoA-carboxylase] ligase [Bacteroidales bacterium]|nr:biotin--[acetyl-CoA-carboxylase] ligase [Bacteroidales bacterium]
MNMIGIEIIRLKEVDSTNRFMMDWLTKEKVNEGTVVITDFQTAGRGADGSLWESERNRNLTFSFTLYPHFLAIDAQFYLNKVISLGLYDIVNELVADKTPVRIKWPNDIYAGDRKIAGILIQNGVKGSQFEYSVIGIGLNVNQDKFQGDASNPVSLKIITGTDSNLTDILEITIDKLESRLAQLREGKKPSIDQDYLDVLYRFNQIASFLYKDKPIQARIIGVSRYGQLQLEIPGEKIIECDLKEIKFKI